MVVGAMRDAQQNIYLARVNLVLDYIATHLDGDLSLKTLAAVAGFSEYHFHRIFKSVTGETLNQFVWRVRVERGAVLLRADPRLSVSAAAARCGFTSLAGFSRAFKARFALAPTQWDRQARLQNEPRVLGDGFPTYHQNALQGCDEQFTVRVREIPAQTLAYVRVYDSYRVDGRISAAYAQLMAWYRAQGGQIDDTTLYGMSMDDRDITPEALCRFDWCLRVPDHWQGDGMVSMRRLPACTVAGVTMNGGDLRTEDQTWQYLWRHWLPRSAYQPAPLPAMEIYHRLPQQPEGGWDTLFLDCAIPVVRLA